jgi:hypothetical protein
MRIRHTLTGKEGYIRVYTWWQGDEFPVFVNGELEFWKQEHVVMLDGTPIVRNVRKVKIEHYDPFEGYTENELEEMYYELTGEAYIKRILDFLIEWYQTRCSKLWT